MYKDVDECNIASSCGTYAVCENNIGSFVCNCQKGFRKSGSLNCVGKY